MIVEHPYEKKIADIFRKVPVIIHVIGAKEPITGILHIDKGLRLSDHLNRTPTVKYLILTDAIYEGQNHGVLFVHTEQIKVVLPVKTDM